jgi:hypothetical protein
MKSKKPISLLAALCLTILLGGCKPAVTITSPQDRDVFAVGEEITFSGTASDNTTGTLPEEALLWTSERDGEIGQGGTFTSSNLSEGVHTITLSATNDAGETGSDTIQITVKSGGTTTTTVDSTNDSWEGIASSVTDECDAGPDPMTGSYECVKMDVTITHYNGRAGILEGTVEINILGNHTKTNATSICDSIEPRTQTLDLSYKAGEGGSWDFVNSQMHLYADYDICSGDAFTSFNYNCLYFDGWHKLNDDYPWLSFEQEPCPDADILEGTSHYDYPDITFKYSLRRKK